MFSLIDEIKDVGFCFTCYGDTLFYSRENQLFSCDTQLNWKVFMPDRIQNIMIINSTIYCGLMNQTATVELHSGKNIEVFDFKIQHGKSSSGLFSAVVRDNNSSTSVLIDPQTNSKVWESDERMGMVYIHNDRLIKSKFRNKRSLSCQDINSNVGLWEFDVSDYANYYDMRKELQEGLISCIMGVLNEVLIISLTSGKLLGVGLGTGNLLYQIGFTETELPQLPFIVSEGDHIPYGELMQLDQQKEEIFGLRDHYFFHVDLTAKDLRRQYFDIGTSMNAYGINAKYRNTEYPYDESYIYFCDDRQGKIGVFDRKRKEVVWSTQLDIEQEGIAQILEMKFANNRWYVLDRHNTLHIFEKT